MTRGACGRWLTVVALAIGAAGAARAQSVARRPWMDAKLPVARRAQLLLHAMTLEERFGQLYMSPGDPLADSAWRHGAFGVQLLALRDSARGNAPDRAAARADSVQRRFVEQTRLGIPAILFEEGVHGLMQHGATVFPAAIGLAASWDTALVREVAGEIAAQSRERGVRMLLSPVVNLGRDPRWGRVEETYGEDPWLSAAMGAAYAGALERAGVVATPKHFVANYGEGGRDSYPVALDQATLEDLYFPPFRAAIDRGGARAIMASYNSVNGRPASASPQLLTRTLRGDWKFNGVVIADQAGVGGANVLHHTAADYVDATAQSLRAGLDVIFQSRAEDARLFWPAIRDGRVPRAVVDSAVARVLRLKLALGLFERPFAQRDTSTCSGTGAAGQCRAAAALAMRAAYESIVLLKNANGLLPFNGRHHRVALIGPRFFPSGGYSVLPVLSTSLLTGLQRGMSTGDSVMYAPGPGMTDEGWSVVPAEALSHGSSGKNSPGLATEIFANPSLSGAPAATRDERVVEDAWTFNRPARCVGTDWFSVRWSGQIEVPPGAPVSLAVEGDDGYRLWIDGVLAVDGEPKVSFGRRTTAMPLSPGAHALRLEYRQTTGNGKIRLLWNVRTGPTAEMLISEAVAVARRADVAVIQVGVDEGEFRDRASLRLPGRQEELIGRVAETGTPVVVVVASGGAVNAVPWIDRVGAVLQVFYPGDAGAEVIGRVLQTGPSPAGRLPYTVPRSDGQLPLVYDHLPTGRGDDYVDLTGQPLFPFGYGASYSTFAYSALELSKTVVTARDTIHVRFTIANTGPIAADEVPQLYVRHVTSPTAQPVLALRGFARVPLAAGESRTIDLPLAVSDLAVRDVDGRRRIVAGDVILYVGASSRDARLRGTVQIR